MSKCLFLAESDLLLEMENESLPSLGFFVIYSLSSFSKLCAAVIRVLSSLVNASVPCRRLLLLQLCLPGHDSLCAGCRACRV